MVRILKRNLLIGLSLGLIIATGYSLWVSVLRLTAGVAPFEHDHITYPQLVGIYYATFSVGGVLVGVCLPLRRWLLGQMFLGFLLVFPVYCGMVAQGAPREEWLQRSNVLFALITSVVVGGAAGAWSWADDRRKSRKSASRSPN